MSEGPVEHPSLCLGLEPGGLLTDGGGPLALRKESLEALERRAAISQPIARSKNA